MIGVCVQSKGDFGGPQKGQTHESIFLPCGGYIDDWSVCPMLGDAKKKPR